MSGMSMGSMSGEAALPSLPYFQHIYWALIGAVIGIAVVINIGNYILFRQRLVSVERRLSYPAKPKGSFVRAYSTITAITREVANVSLGRFRFCGETFIIFPSGLIIILLLNLILLLVLCFYGFNTSDQWKWEDIGYRTGYMSICQIPLIFLLAGKKNIIGALTGSSYERLNVLHRWTARTLLLTSTIHLGYWFTSWARYDYIAEKIRDDSITRKGLGAWGILIWIVFSSMTPIRGWCYELFVLQHIVSFAAFIALVYVHTPTDMHVWIWVPIGLFLLDRLVRFLSVTYTNVWLFHPSRRARGSKSPLWAFEATFTPLPHHMTRISIDTGSLHWEPGQHVFLSCHSILPLQSHPFTIASLPSDGKMEFLIRAQGGGTRRFFHHAEKTLSLPVRESKHEEASRKSMKRIVSIEGPYGSMRPLRQFDTIVLISGSTGATFTIPLLRDLVRRWKLRSDPPTNATVQSSLVRPAESLAVTRRIRYVAVVRSADQLSWFSEQLRDVAAVVASLRAAGHKISLDIATYITCDSSVTTPISDQSSSASSHTSRSSSRTSSEGMLSGEKAAATRKSSEMPKENVDSGSCGPDGSCCCRDMAASPPSGQAIAPCMCNSSGTKPTKPEAMIGPVVTGRPPLRDLIRIELEQAEGESAVVVCGPLTMNQDVRQAVVALSDERAACRGTGAHGIWFWDEGFGY
ncbi:MAG: hypothetical protein M1825_002588 [Sarcosagium campestre]|nr:MAG: hypothetical protein M1825_002588 [Sarcosagium campestre]